MYTIFHKEYRQQRALFAVMLLFCFLIQFGYMLMKFFNGITIDFNTAALFSAALYAGAAATVAFAGECEDKTFDFLRRLPLTAETVMYGKTAWIILSTAVMLICSAALAVFWQLTDGGTANLGTRELWGILGTGIIETLVWGLFWSSRCRNPYYAVMLTYGCASVSAFIAANLISNAGTTSADAYFRAVPLRLAVCAVVAVLAVRGMRRWFSIEDSQEVMGCNGRINIKNFPFSLPVKTSSPFLVLMFHAVRQSRMILFIGIVLTIVYAFFVSKAVLEFIPSQNTTYYEHRTPWANRNIDWFNVFDSSSFTVPVICFYLFFCGSIFSPDQKNGTYRILTRFGIAPGKVWLSKILPFAAVVLFSFILFMVSIIASKEGFFILPENLFVLYLIPFAAGSFTSISVKNQIVSVALTGTLSMVLLAWMFLGITACAFNPVWFVLPLCAALLLASYLQTNNWLTERSGWKMYLLPLLPFVLTGAVICAAVPPVRIYSIPFVPFSEIETALQNIPLAERIPAEKSRALFQQIQNTLDKPLTDEEWFNEDLYIMWNYTFYRLAYSYRTENGKISEYDEHSQNPRYRLEKVKNGLNASPSFEEAILKFYAWQYRVIKAAEMPKSDSFKKNYGFMIHLYRCLPWEKERALRRLNLGLLDSCRIGTLNLPNDFLRNDLVQPLFYKGFFDTGLDFFGSFRGRPATDYIFTLSKTRLQLVVLALECWYKEHNNTLPRTLDELVENGYLDSIPVAPWLGEKMQYCPDADKEELETYKIKKLSKYGHIPGWQRVYFDTGVNHWIFSEDLTFLPDYQKTQKNEE